MCVAARVWVMELCRAMQTVAVKDGRNKTDKQIDRQTVGWAGRKAGRPAGWLADRNASWTWLITCQHYDEDCMYVCACVPICVCALLAKNLLDSRKLNIVPAKWLNAFSLSSSSSLPLSISLSIISSCRWRVIFVLSALFFGHAFLGFPNYATFI